MIEPDRTSSSSSASELDFRAAFDAKLGSKDPWDQVFALYKMFSILRGLEGKELNPWDRQLIKGIYQRNLNSLKHLQKPNEVPAEDSDEEWSVDLSNSHNITEPPSQAEFSIIKEEDEEEALFQPSIQRKMTSASKRTEHDRAQ